MILGILSDTHGRVATARAAIHRLATLGCDHFIHCGDLGDGVVSLLPEGRSTIVFGNTDYDLAAIRCDAEAIGIQCLNGGGVIVLDDVGIAVTHGDDPRLLRDLLANPVVRYLCTGHTHVPHDRREGQVRWINPGALHRAATKTVATLDLAKDELTYHTIATAM